MILSLNKDELKTIKDCIEDRIDKVKEDYKNQKSIDPDVHRMVQAGIEDLEKLNAYIDSKNPKDH
jgi:ribosomal protein S13